MLNNVVSRYRPAYRTAEIDFIIGCAKRGESLGFVGMAGIGKSNVVNFLRNLQNNAPDKGEQASQLHFPIVDAIQWQGKPEHLWQLMLNALNMATEGLAFSAKSGKVIPFSDDERLFKILQEQVQAVCQELKHQVMFILDDFDRVLETGPLALLEQLNVLRSEGNRGFLSYLVFTKRLPHILGQNHPLENKSKFYDLFRYHIYALEPYTHDDALRMLDHLNRLAGSGLTFNQLEQIYRLTGGHAGLLKLVFNVWVEGGAAGVKAKYFADRPEIKQECKRVLGSLHEHEQEVALRAARGQQTAQDQDVLDHLWRRGMLTQISPVSWFSPLMALFLGSYEGEN